MGVRRHLSFGQGMGFCAAFLTQVDICQAWSGAGMYGGASPQVWEPKGGFSITAECGAHKGKQRRIRRDRQ